MIDRVTVASSLALGRMGNHWQPHMFFSDDVLCRLPGYPARIRKHPIRQCYKPGEKYMQTSTTSRASNYT